MTTADRLRHVATQVATFAATIRRKTTTLDAGVALMTKWGEHSVEAAIDREARNRCFGWGK